MSFHKQGLTAASSTIEIGFIFMVRLTDYFTTIKYDLLEEDFIKLTYNMHFIKYKSTAIVGTVGRIDRSNRN